MPHDANSPRGHQRHAHTCWCFCGRCRLSLTSFVCLLAAGRQWRSPHVQGKPTASILGDWNHQLGARLCQTTKARSLHLYTVLLRLDKGLDRTHAPAPTHTNNHTSPHETSPYDHQGTHCIDSFHTCTPPPPSIPTNHNDNNHQYPVQLSLKLPFLATNSVSVNTHNLSSNRTHHPA